VGSICSGFMLAPAPQAHPIGNVRYAAVGSICSGFMLAPAPQAHPI